VFEPAHSGVTVAEKSPLYPLPTGAGMRARPRP
jgi:hypothetical protein